MLERKTVEREEEQQQGGRGNSQRGRAAGRGKEAELLVYRVGGETRRQGRATVCGGTTARVGRRVGGVRHYVGKVGSGKRVCWKREVRCCPAKPTCLTGTGTKGRLSLVYSTYPRGSETNTRVKSGETTEPKTSKFCVEAKP